MRSDFRPDWVNTFEKKTNESDPDRSDLDALVDALASDDADLLSAIEPLVDVDAFLRFWATEALLGDWDSYSNNLNNFYIYRNPTDGKFHFIPWGPDATFGPRDVWSRFDPPSFVYATAILSQRLYGLPEVRANYLAVLHQLLDQTWDEASLMAEVSRTEELVADEVQISATKFQQASQDLRNYVALRRATITSDLADGAGDWTHPLRSSACPESIGALSAWFETTWNDGSPDWAPGPDAVSISMELDGLPQAFTLYAVGAGPSSDKQTIGLWARRDDGAVLRLSLGIEPEAFAPSSTLPVDFFTVSGFLFRKVDGESERMIGGLRGTLELDEASTTRHEPVSGSVTGDLLGMKYWRDE